jgi:hypothetical protein
MFFPYNLVSWDGLPFFICTYPQLGVHLLFGYYLALEYMAHQQVVIHCLCDNLRDRCRVELNEAVVF